MQRFHNSSMLKMGFLALRTFKSATIVYHSLTRTVSSRAALKMKSREKEPLSGIGSGSLSGHLLSQGVAKA